MSFTNIVTHLEPAESAVLAALLATPLALAAAHGAHLTALVFPVETDGDAAKAEDDAMAQTREAAAARGVSCEIRPRSSFAQGVGNVFVDHLRVADLGIVTWRAEPGLGQRMVVNAAIFDSGRPVLVVPEGRPLLAAPERVVIAWDGSASAVRATHGAMPFLQAATETLVITVDDEAETEAAKSGIALTQLLARHGARARAITVPRQRASVLEAIVAAAREHTADMIVMGGLRHAPLLTMVLGSATQDLLDRGPRIATLIAA